MHEGSVIANGTKEDQLPTSNIDARESMVKVAFDKLKNSSSQGLRRPYDEARVSTGNGEVSDDTGKAAEEYEESIPGRNKAQILIPGRKRRTKTGQCPETRAGIGIVSSFCSKISLLIQLFELNMNKEPLFLHISTM